MPTGFLAQAVREARVAAALARAERPLSTLVAALPNKPPLSFADALRAPGFNVIAEIKYRSPSRGPMGCTLPPNTIAAGYASAGAAALSVLTNEPHFGGSLRNLRVAAAAVSIPLLRKDFIVDPYQLLEARLNGASSCLLIAAAVGIEELSDLVSAAREYRLEPMVEAHGPAEYEKARKAGAQIIGINSRNLQNLMVDLSVPFTIARLAQGDNCLLVAESGIDRPAQISALRDAGFSAFLIGSAFMRNSDPAAALRKLLEGCRAD